MQLDVHDGDFDDSLSQHIYMYGYMSYVYIYMYVHVHNEISNVKSSDLSTVKKQTAIRNIFLRVTTVHQAAPTLSMTD